MNFKLRQFCISVSSIALLAVSLSACTQAPAVNNADYYANLGSNFDYGNSNSGALRISPTSTAVGLSGTVQFSATGAPPYVFNITSGNGAIDSDTGFFQASANGGTVLIEVRDIRGAVSTAVVVVSSAAGSNQGGVGNGALNYAPGVVSFGVVGAGMNCNADQSVVGSVQSTNDARLFCASKTYISATSTVVADIMVTAGGSHAAAVSCPNGFSQVGTIPDCNGGICSGVQAVCAKTAPANSVSRYVTNFYVSNSGAHVPTGPGCPYGYTAVGNAVDCGGGVCSGYQHFCKSTN